MTVEKVTLYGTIEPGPSSSSHSSPMPGDHTRGGVEAGRRMLSIDPHGRGKLAVDGIRPVYRDSPMPATDWKPMNRAELDEILNRELQECSVDQQAFFKEVGCPPGKWRQSPWGDAGDGFWAVATRNDRVLWYNDIEHGFNVSRFTVPGTIPENEYWCNQDELRWALPRLAGESAAMNLGPPQPVPDA